MPSTTEIVPFSAHHADQFTDLFNAHLGAVVPGFALPATYLSERLTRDPGESIVDPWVVERRTLLAVDHDRVVAATHILRYGATPDVGPAYRNAAEVAWLIAWPPACEPAERLLTAATDLIAGWGIEDPFLCTGSMFVPSLSGIPETWPHIAAVVRMAGFAPDAEREELLYAGRIDHLEPPAEPPVDGLRLERRLAEFAPRFKAVLDGEPIGYFDVGFDVTEGGRLPALAGWADPWSLWVDERHRSQGVGSWLVRSAIPYLRLAGCDRMLVPVAIEDDGAGAGRFYERLGLMRVARLDRAWTAVAKAADQPAAS
jgi:GNAT superfamily N-acetyltransferase